MSYVLAALAGYLLGSVPVALLVARRHGVDLYQTADGNPGAWNALEQLGGRRAAPAFFGDAGKAALAGLAGYALGDWWTAWTGVAAAMVGHAFPLFARGRGGKSVMSFVGGGIVLSPQAGLVALAAFGLLWAWRGLAPAARVGVFAFPAVQLAFDPAERVLAVGALMGLIGALFALGWVRGRRSGPATSVSGAPPRA